MNTVIAYFFKNLLSLEVNLTKDELKRIKQYDANFNNWLAVR